MHTEQHLRTGDICKKAGIDRETLRFYEMRGLLPEPRRSLNGYREYPPDTLLRLDFIRQCKAAGFTLAEIGRMLSLTVDSDFTELRTAAESQIAALDARIAELQAMRALLSELASKPIAHADAGCPILRLFAMKGRK
jgi:DNA-binding transcriptional MerR regulator